MKKKKKIIDEEVIGLGVGIVNTNSKEFKALQTQIITRAKKQTKKQLLENSLLSLRFQMESYLAEERSELVEVGWFLKELIKRLNIKNKLFAEYIGFKESNLSALFSGKRKINIDLALKLGEIFKIDPALWIHIQSKNELSRMKKENKKAYEKYSMEDLLKRAS